MSYVRRQQFRRLVGAGEAGFLSAIAVLLGTSAVAGAPAVAGLLLGIALCLGVAAGRSSASNGVEGARGVGRAAGHSNRRYRPWLTVCDGSG